MKKKLKNITPPSKNKPGFTLIEVMLVLAITGLMLIGIIGGSYTVIARQRYTDAINGFADYISRMYSEVISPESLGQGNSSDVAVLGKVLVFGEDYENSQEDSRSVYSAILVGSANIAQSNNDKTFIEEITDRETTKAQLFCGDAEHQSTVSSYLPLWESELLQAGENRGNGRFKGTIIIARTPTSNTVHTIYAKDLVYNLRDHCTPENSTANTAFTDNLYEEGKDKYDSSNRVRICLKTFDNPIIREVDIAADGNNTSAISILSESESEC